MRQLKFRVPTNCQNGHFRWAYLSFGGAYTDWSETKLEWGPRNCDCPTGNYGEGYSQIVGSGKQQFTGLKDRRGKEVFEGDIMGDLDRKEAGIFGLVVWEENHAQFILVRDIFLDNGGLKNEGIELVRELDVIGNYFDPLSMKLVERGLKHNE